MRPRLYIVETHPIQYKAPLFRALAADLRLEVKILYAMLPDATQQGAGFGVSFAWDVPLLDGYPYQVMKNVAREPSVTRFGGCDTPEIYDILKRERPDAVLVNGWVVKTCLQALWACRRLGIPCLVRGEANLLRARAWWKHALHRLLLSQYSGYLYIGSANRDFYRFHGCREDRLFFAPYAVDNDVFAKAADERAALRKQLRDKFGLLPDAVVFLFAGKLEEKKRPLDIVRAASQLPLHLKPKMNIVFAGDGPLRPLIEREAVLSGVHTICTGFLNQTVLPDAYAATDVLILPSDAGETWGLVVNEAMASGRPAIVSTLAGCARDLVVDGQTGYSFVCGNIAEMSSIMMRYLDHPAVAPAQGEAARVHIKQYRIQAAADGVEMAVRKVTG